jgi:hypothetical protein
MVASKPGRGPNVRRDASENFNTFSLHCAHRVQFLRIPDPILDAAKRGKGITIT